MAARKENLVSEHMENVSAAMLEKYQALIREYIRGRQDITL